MTFEEFFKKKKIALPAFEQAEPALFTEFKAHYEAMGEKSFDHTKKYWFNKLRGLYPLPSEPKVEKVVIENKLSEQTIAEALNEKPEPIVPAPKVGFTPRFKPGVTKPAQPNEEKPAEESATEKSDEGTSASAQPKGFTPRFKTGVTKPAQAAEQKSEGIAEGEKSAETASAEKSIEEKPAAPAPKGFTPRFKAGVTKPQATTSDVKDLPPAESATSTPEVNKAAESKDQNPEFQQEKDAMQQVANSTERRVEAEESPDEPEKEASPKPAYNPRFNMKNIKPNSPESE